MTALVTGASRGIGEQFALQLADRGVNLVLVARSGGQLQELASDLRGRHSELDVTVHAADLSDAGEVNALATKLTSSGVAIDVLINNAGVGSHGRFIDQDPVGISHEIQLNCVSLVALTRELLPAMVAQGQGGIINVSSTAAFQPVPTMAVYAASKAFVLSFTEALWGETGASGVRVMALCPGPTETRFFETADPTKQFLTRGRQSPAHVAEVALRSFDGSRHASVVPGVANRLLANGYRIMPRAVMVRMAERNVRAS